MAGRLLAKLPAPQARSRTDATASASRSSRLVEERSSATAEKDFSCSVLPRARAKFAIRICEDLAVWSKHAAACSRSSRASPRSIPLVPPLKALRDTRALPSSDFGPVECFQGRSHGCTPSSAFIRSGSGPAAGDALRSTFVGFALDLGVDADVQVQWGYLASTNESSTASTAARRCVTRTSPRVAPPA